MELTFAFGANTPIVADYDLVLDSNGNAHFFEDYTTTNSKARTPSTRTAKEF